MAVLYRASHLGAALSSALNEMIDAEAVPAPFADTVFAAFDRIVADALKSPWMTSGTARPSRMQGKIVEGKLDDYRYVDNVWTFNLSSAKFKAVREREPGCFSADEGFAPPIVAQRIRIVAADTKLFSLSQTSLSSFLTSSSSSLNAANGQGTGPEAGGASSSQTGQQRAKRPAPEAGAARQETGLPATVASRDAFVEEGDDDDFADEEEPDNGSQLIPSQGGSASTSKRARTDATLAVTAGDDDGEELNSDDDDDDALNSADDEADAAEGAAGVQNLVLAQFEKVKRTRNKWHCVLKAGMATINGMDFAFTSCEAEFVDGW